MVKAYSGNYQVFASGMFFSFSGHDDFRLEAIDSSQQVHSLKYTTYTEE